MLLEKSLAPVVDAIKNKRKHVTFFLGAGISTSCGIPDFRSPKTGLYSNLKRLKLPYPEAVFDIDYFKESPKAFYTLAEELYPGKFVPSKFHFLLVLFQKKKLLNRVYTQNIDTLERIAGVEGEYIVEAHGSFADNHCVDCDESMTTEELKGHMFNKDVNDGIPTCPKCKGYVKPDIVFFGEGLPERFFDLWDKDSEAVEVAIVAGTSLTVYPFASLPAECGTLAIRVLFNKEVVGDFKKPRKSDIIVESDCDQAADILADLLGWKDELEALVSDAVKEFAKKNSDEKQETLEEKSNEIAEAVKKAEEGTLAEAQEENSSEKESDLEAQLGKLSI